MKAESAKQKPDSLSSCFIEKHTWQASMNTLWIMIQDRGLRPLLTSFFFHVYRKVSCYLVRWNDFQFKLLLPRVCIQVTSLSRNFKSIAGNPAQHWYHKIQNEKGSGKRNLSRLSSRIISLPWQMAHYLPLSAGHSTPWPIKGGLGSIHFSPRALVDKTFQTAKKLVGFGRHFFLFVMHMVYCEPVSVPSLGAVFVCL